MNPPQPRPWPVVLRCMIGFAVCLTLVGLIYTEENWRGNRAWENCKRALQGQGVKLAWADYLPASVPVNDNVLGAPEMQKWFAGRGPTEFSKKMAYPELAGRGTTRLILADLTIGLPGPGSTSGSNVLHWEDPRAPEQAARLIKDALGPVALDPASMDLLLLARRPEGIQPAQILVQCQTAPTPNELRQFLPKLSAITDSGDSEEMRLEPNPDGSYRITILAPAAAASFLQWSDGLEPDFALVRNALQRTRVRMDGDYSNPYGMPVPNFVTIRVTVQTLAAMAQCHLMQGNPEEALRDITLIHDLCRILTERQPMTLVAAMINVAVMGLYADTISFGIRLHGWREPQLAALEEQLKQTDLLTPVRQAYELERVFILCIPLEKPAPGGISDLVFIPSEKANSWKDREDWVLQKLTPRGWIHQNMVAAVNVYSNAIASVDPARQLAFPEIAEAQKREADATKSHWGVYNFAADIVPNFIKATQTTSRNQTMVNQALVACALERYRLAHGEYPETLEALSPRFIATIPHDVIGGLPLHYRCAADGAFILYSVGWNGVDDSGVRGNSATNGDWVWPPLAGC